MTRRLVLLGAIVAWLMSAAGFASAADPPELRAMTTREMVAASRGAVYARAVSVEVKDLAQYGGMTFSFTTFAVLQKIVGDVSDPFVLRLVGGASGNVDVHDATTPRFNPGDEVILLLGPTNADGYATIMFGTGVMRVKSLPSGQKAVSTPVSGITLYHASDGSSYSQPPRVLPLGDLMYSLRKTPFGTALRR